MNTIRKENSWYLVTREWVDFIILMASTDLKLFTSFFCEYMNNTFT